VKRTSRHTCHETPFLFLSATFVSPTLGLENTSFTHSLILLTLGLIYVEIQNEMYEESVWVLFTFLFVYLYTTQVKAGLIDVESFMFISCLFLFCFFRKKVNSVICFFVVRFMYTSFRRENPLSMCGGDRIEDPPVPVAMRPTSSRV
jgi:hypothetical protein